MRPFIGVTCSSDENGQPRVNPLYVRALHRAGALPVPLPWAPDEAAAHELLERLHGVLLTGSEDLDPALWGEPRHPRTVLMHPARMATEVHLCRALLERRPPVLAICGGMQTLNVIAGGTLHQHIPDLGPGRCEHSDPSFTRFHDVRGERGSLIASVLGDEFAANTEHHQAVNALGEGLRAAAFCTDGLLEAYEATSGPFLVGVQWHPERMPAGHDGHATLFERLGAAAAAAL